MTVDGQVGAASRNRLLDAHTDNSGFYAWTQKNKEEIARLLGPGRHYGEWWGAGIQRRYTNEKQKFFSLFNVTQWEGQPLPQDVRVVPVLYRGPFNTEEVNKALELLRTSGSVASPGCKTPEGIVVFHTAANVYFKQTLDKDELPKGLYEMPAVTA